MSQYQLPFKVEVMTPANIPQAVVIEQAAYADNYAKRDFIRELEYNQVAHYFVIHFVNAAHKSPATTMVGVGGFWLISNQLHIITVAVHPNWQELGLGELLLLTLLEAGLSMKAKIATLEVRPSNQSALMLYKKYNFQEEGRRLHYYGNNGEDALILTTPALNLPGYQAMLTRRKTKLFARLSKINVDKADQVH